MEETDLVKSDRGVSEWTDDVVMWFGDNNYASLD